jgi:hypothetical protein
VRLGLAVDVPRIDQIVANGLWRFPPEQNAMSEAQTWASPAHLTAPIGVEVVPFVVVCCDASVVVLLQM